MKRHPPEEPDLAEEIPEAEVVPAGARFTMVWLLPLVALLAGVWLLYKTFTGEGPDIIIHFDTAAGIEAKKTPIKYRGVEVGRVENVRYAPDLSHVIVEARMVRDADAFLNENTKFWVVRPRIGTAGISGLGTLISGAYIEMDPGKGTHAVYQFEGLKQPPGVTSDRKGSVYHLQAETLGSLSVGSPVYFRQVPVGEIVGYHLTKDHRHVDISAFVEAPHDDIVRSNTRFWKVAGIDFRLTSEGVKLKMESLTTLLTGGIAFETPSDLQQSARPKADRAFTLYESHAATRRVNPQHTLDYVLYFEDTVRGLQVGAPVEFRGIRVGMVKDFRLKVEESGRLRIPVLVAFDTDRFHEMENHDGRSEKELDTARRRFVEKLVEKGLRARLQTANFLTGQLYVELDFFPDAVPAKVKYGGRFPELPTQPRPFVSLMASVTHILGKLERIPLDEIAWDIKESAAGASRLINDPQLRQAVQDLGDSGRSIRELMQSLSHRSESLLPKVQKVLDKATAALEQASRAFQRLGGVTDKNTTLGAQLYQALEQFAAASRSIRAVAEYLERHPESLLRGKQ